jgi:poly(glycerol-phosphate) alpha-glucosyltransferase
VRLLFVIPYYYPAVAFGGPVAIAGGLAEDLVRRGHTVTVLTTDVASRTARIDSLAEVRNGVRVVRLRNFSIELAGRANLYTPRGTKRVLDQLLDEHDLCHVFDYFTWLTYRAVERAFKKRVPIVISPLGSLSLDPARGRTLVKTLLQRTLGTLTLRRASRVHAQVEAEAVPFRALGVPDERIVVIANGVATPGVHDGAPFRADHAVGDRRIVLFVGRLLAGKGVDLLLEVARRRHDRSLAFVLVGPAENRDDLARPGWFTDNVLLTGLLRGDLLEQAYAAADIFTLPSFSEGLPMSALEALTRGLPCVLSKACNLPEVEEAGAGVCVEPEVDALEEAIDDVLSRPRAPMSESARSLAAARFSGSAVHERMELEYRRLLA